MPWRHQSGRFPCGKVSGVPRAWPPSRTRPVCAARPSSASLHRCRWPLLHLELGHRIVLHESKEVFLSMPLLPSCHQTRTTSEEPFYGKVKTIAVFELKTLASCRCCARVEALSPAAMILGVAATFQVLCGSRAQLHRNDAISAAKNAREAPNCFTDYSRSSKDAEACMFAAQRWSSKWTSGEGK